MRVSLIQLFVIGLFTNLSLAGPTRAQEVLSRRISLSINEQKVETVLGILTRQTGVRFMYIPELIQSTRTVTVTVKEETLGNVLNKLLTPLQINYQVTSRNQILLKRMPKQSLFEQLFPSTTEKESIVAFTVSGKVVDHAGGAIPGATVLLKGSTNTGTSTNEKGEFTLSLPDSARALVVSSIGFVTQEVMLNNRTYIEVKLAADVQALDAVMVVGYGTTSIRKNTAAVAKVETEKLENLPLTSIADGLAGRAPGLIVSTSGAGPGVKPTISIRGGNQPLFVIDGVISTQLDFNNINSNDIESFQVLKDAAATAVYGTRGGNGVILITTKRGKAGESVIRYDYNYDLSQPTYLPQKLSSYERALISNEAKINDGLPPDYSEEVLAKFRDQTDPVNYPNTDWQKLALKRFAPQMRHNISLSGGTERTQYFASLGYFDQGTLYTQKTNWLKRYNYRINMTNNFDKIGLKAEINLSGAIEKLNQPASQYGSGYYYIWGHIQNKSPMTPAFNDKGEYANSGDHPLVEMDPRSGYDRSTDKFVNGNMMLSWAVPGVKGLSVKALGNYRMGNFWEKMWTQTAPQYAIGSDVAAIANKPNLFTNAQDNWSYSLQGHINYETIIAKHHNVSAAVIYEESYSYGENFNATRRNYQLPVDQLASGPTENMENNGSAAESARAGYVGRLRYDYKGKYMLEGNFRYDGNDNFPKGNRWGFFPSISAGWTVSDEGFFQPVADKNILSYLKIRGSIGSVAQDGSAGTVASNLEIPRYGYLPGYSLNQRTYMVGGVLVPGFSEGALPSPDITWYTQNSRNIGLEFTTLSGKLNGSFDYFYIRTTGYLASPSGTKYSDPLGTALPTVKTNGAHRRAGFEFSLNYRNNIGELRYSVGGNLSKYDQLWEVNPTEDEATLKNPDSRTTHQKDYWGRGYIAEGFYQTHEEILNSPKRAGSVNLAPGDIRYRDVNGDGQLDAADQVRIGKQIVPHIMYGVNLDLQYKGFFLNSLFQGAGDRSVYVGDVIRQQVTYEFQKDYWTPENRNATYPRLISSSGINGDNNYVTSTFWLANGRYVRLKTLQLGYDVKSGLLSRAGFIRTLRISLTAQNLLTVSPLRKFYMDPESGSDNNYAYPIQRTFSLGVNVAF